MLGHRLARSLGEPFEVWSTVRGEGDESRRVFGGVIASDLDSIDRALNRVEPEAVVNCIGIVKQRPEGKDPDACTEVNALLPHRLAAITKRAGARLVHISTDCVFSGKKGGYTEYDPCDAEDVYGRTKALGEVDYPHAVTLRTSIIGRELSGGLGLVEWFLRQDQPVRGYTEAWFSGLTTHELTRVIARVLLDHPGMRGVWQVSSEPIDKCSLLLLLREAFGLSTPIMPCPEPAIDRTLDSTRFRRATGYRPPTWPEMVREMAEDATISVPMEAMSDSQR